MATLVTSSDPALLWEQSWHVLLGMAVVLLLVRPLALAAQNLITHQAISANVANMIRWQTHWHVARQSWAFFQNDFAGRIATRVLQTGPAVRESLVALITGVWYILVYGTSALFLLASADRWLALPIGLWFMGYLVLLRVFVPRMRDRSRRSPRRARCSPGASRYLHQHPHRELFARARNEDAYVRDAIDEHTGCSTPRCGSTRCSASACRRSTPCWSPAPLPRHRAVGPRQGPGRYGGDGAAAVVADHQHPGWVAMRITEIFENIGVVQEGMMTIARPRPHRSSRRQELTVPRGEIRFEDVRFGYGRESGLIEGLTLTVRAGERIGLVGRSGAGKSTLVNLLLRFFDIENGRILIDGRTSPTSPRRACAPRSQW